MAKRFSPVRGLLHGTWWTNEPPAKIAPPKPAQSYTDYRGNWQENATSDAMGAEVLGVMMGTIKDEDCTWAASASIARMARTVEVDKDGIEYVNWKGKK